MTIKTNESIFLSLPEITKLSVPPKTILLEEGRIADKLFLIRKGCLRLFFNNQGQDITFQFFSRGISSHRSTACINGHRAFFLGEHRAG